MRIAFVIFHSMTALDLISVYDPLTRLKIMGGYPDLSWELCSFTATVQDDRGMIFTPTMVCEPLRQFDILVMPGGLGTRTMIDNEAVVNWLRTAQDIPLKASVCTGALLLGAAGFLHGLRATTHPNAYDLLAPYCATVVKDQRVVDENSVITARGVTAGIDLGLHLVERLAGKEVREKIQTQMDYPTQSVS